MRDPVRRITEAETDAVRNLLEGVLGFEETPWSYEYRRDGFRATITNGDGGAPTTLRENVRLSAAFDDSTFRDLGTFIDALKGYLDEVGGDMGQALERAARHGE